MNLSTDHNVEKIIKVVLHSRYFDEYLFNVRESYDIERMLIEDFRKRYGDGYRYILDHSTRLNVETDRDYARNTINLSLVCWMKEENYLFFRLRYD